MVKYEEQLQAFEDVNSQHVKTIDLFRQQVSVLQKKNVDLEATVKQSSKVVRDAKVEIQKVKKECNDQCVRALYDLEKVMQSNLNDSATKLMSAEAKNKALEAELAELRTMKAAFDTFTQCMGRLNAAPERCTHDGGGGRGRGGKGKGSWGGDEFAQRPTEDEQRKAKRLAQEDHARWQQLSFQTPEAEKAKGKEFREGNWLQGKGNMWVFPQLA